MTPGGDGLCREAGDLVWQYAFSLLRRARRTPTKKNMIEKIHPDYGAIDIGEEKIFIACGGCAEVRSFATFSADLQEAADYLCAQGVEQVAMEATGVYWIPLHDVLESRKIKVTV